MKRRLFIFLAVAIMAVCSLAVVASADTIVPSTSNEYGALTTFDEAIGRLDIAPEKADGTIARTVLFDGTNYYTVPTTYLLTKNNYEGQNKLFQLGFSAINSKLGKSFNKNSMIRCELPSSITHLGNDAQCFNGCNNIIEIKLCDGLRFAANSAYKAFSNCRSITELDLSMMVIEHTKSTYSLFEYCDKLVTIKLPDAHLVEGKPVDYATDYTFNGCKVLETIENYENFFRGSTSINQKMFMDCAKLPEIKLWDGIVTIGGRAFQGCSSITYMIIPDSVTTIGTTETVFASCTSLQKLVLPSGSVSLGNYCFEKCTALTDVWMPSGASTFAGQVFGQCGSSLNVNFYFTTATSTITITNTTENRDPFIAAINAENDARLKYNTPLSTKCTVFLGGHNASNIADCTADVDCTRCKVLLAEGKDAHSVVITIEYVNGFASEGVKATKCTNDGCKACDKSENAPVIFTAKGYSYAEDDGTGLSGGFGIDILAFNAYNEANPDKTLEISLLIVNPKYLDKENSFFDANADVIATQGAVQVAVRDVTYSGISYMIGGFSLEHMQETELCFALVVNDGEGVQVVQKQYAANEASTTKATYTDKNGITLQSVTVEMIAPEFVAELKKKEETL